MANFVIKNGAGVWWPVMVAVAIDGGNVEQQTFEVKFKRLDVAGIEAARQLQDPAWVAATILDWRGVHIGDDGQLPFNAENVDVLLAQPNLAAALGTAWAAFVSAQPETRLGNSEASPAGGPAAAAPTAATPAT